MHETTVLLPVASITLGERRRDEYGDLDGLAESIGKYGLIHPIVVDNSYVVIAGGRRFKAAEMLGLETIPARLYGELSDAEKREIELEENLRRKDLTAFERDKTIVTLAEVAAEVLNDGAEATPDSLADSANESTPMPRKRGGQPKADSEEKVAARIGTKRKTLNDAKRHVETAEQYPFMQRPEWQQYHVLEARALLEKLPDDERALAAALLDQPGIPPPDAIQTLANLGDFSPATRAEVYRRAASPDEEDRTRALTLAARRPLMSDRRISHLSSVLSELGKCIPSDAADPISLRLIVIRDELATIRRELKEAYTRERDADLAAR